MSYSLGYAEAQSNGTVGQFAKRNKTPYPPNEDTIEEEKVEAENLVLEANLPLLLGYLGNQTLQESLCQLRFLLRFVGTPRLILSVDGLWPNPFAGLNTSDVNLQAQEFLYLVDGSEYGQVSVLDLPVSCIMD